MEHTITPNNVDKESYYNLTRLCDLTRYAHPANAIKHFNEKWVVQKDDNGNITQFLYAEAISA